MAADFRVAPNEWECQVFIAVAETHGAEAATRRLEALRGTTYERQSVEKVLRKLENWVGEPLLERHADRKLYPTVRGQDFLESARKVVMQYRLMRGEIAGRPPPKLACLPHHTHFVAVAEDLLFHEPPEETDKVSVEYLPQNHRGEGEFHRHAVQPLRNNVYQLLIGPRVEDPSFESRTLYYAQLEAMVGRAYPTDEIALADLVQRHRMFVPPVDMRSRRLLEERIAAWRITDPGAHARVAAETYETATSVLRIRNEHHRRGTSDSRVVVVPSDVALAYKEGMEFGGRHADRFKWVPIYHRDDEGNEHLLRMEVCVTIRRNGSAELSRIVAALTAAVRKLNEGSDRVGLCGAPFRGKRPALIPAQASRNRAERVD